MKTLILLCSLILSGITIAQNFTPFSYTSPKRFENITISSNESYFFYPINIETNGSVITFQQYKKRGNSQTDVSNIPSCWGWGGGGMQPAMDTLWSGDYIEIDTVANILQLENSNNESLEFNFNINQGDSSVFYQNATDVYYIKNISEQQESFLSINDNVRTFTILHYDNSQSIINSLLHGFEIKLSELYGLLTFMECHLFPAVESGFQLVGQVQDSGTLGYYQMTYDEAFPWDTGDTLIYSGVNSYGANTPLVTQYRQYAITNRVETSDSVFIYFDENVQTNSGYPAGQGPSAYCINYQSPIAYRKNDPLFKQPAGMKGYGYTHYSQGIDSTCSPAEYTQIGGDYSTYCDSCNCLMPADGFGQTISVARYIKGFGKARMYNKVYGPTGSNQGSSLLYSNIGGVVCGDPITLGISEKEINFTVQPNPAKVDILVSSPLFISSIRILNIDGKEFIRKTVNNTQETINIEHLSPGVYFVISNIQGIEKVQRIIIE